MLRGNLSTKPFYNERLASLMIAVLAAVTIGLTIYNARELTTLSTNYRALTDRVDADRRAADATRTATVATERQVDRAALVRLSAATSEANDVIRQRTFSWTALFGLIERTLPLDVRLVVVSPRVERGALRVALTVVARDLADVSDFVDALLATGRFDDAATLEQQRREDGGFSAVVEAAYVAADPEVSAPSTAVGSPGTSP